MDMLPIALVKEGFAFFKGFRKLLHYTSQLRKEKVALCKKWRTANRANIGKDPVLENNLLSFLYQLEEFHKKPGVKDWHHVKAPYICRTCHTKLISPIAFMEHVSATKPDPENA